MSERILGYTDRLSAVPGDAVNFKISAPLAGKFKARLIRLICGDDSPEGPGFKAENIDSEIDGIYPARQQRIMAGSYVWVTARQPFDLLNFTVQAMIWPTLPGNGKPQAILGNYDAATGSGYALYVDETGCLAFRAGHNARSRPVSNCWGAIGTKSTRSSIPAPAASRIGHNMMLAYHGMAASRQPDRDAGRADRRGRPFPDRRLERRQVRDRPFQRQDRQPARLGRALKPAEVERLRELPLDVELAQYVVAAWDFSRGMSTVKVTDVSGNRYHGRTINLPTRAMTGWNWDPSDFSWQSKPDQYGAVHFHDDDLYDCGWRTDFTLTVPADLKSGIYCAHIWQKTRGWRQDRGLRPVLRAAGTRDRDGALSVPGADGELFSLMPTSRWSPAGGSMNLSSGKFATMGLVDQYLEEHESFGLSVYDEHTDGSGVCYSSHLRPILNMRPKTDLWQFNADTHLTDWLEKKKIPYDVITDDDLHAEGVECLRPYRCVMTGTHPEYYSKAMLDALQAFTNGGGRLMYMGANGFYWRIAYHAGMPGVIEHRRAEDGMRAWFSESGEYFMSFTGEMSGLWARNGRPPNMLVGNAFAAQGFVNAVPYHRTPESQDVRVSFMFEGIGAEEVIGDFGTVGGGAAGWEIDRADTQAGDAAPCADRGGGAPISRTPITG